MKKHLLLISALLLLPLLGKAQGWPENYGGVMLQAFSWNSFGDTRWVNLTKQAQEMSSYFDLVWVPQSGWTGSTSSMGYDPKYYFDQRSAFGSADELRTMISTFKGYGTGMIADVVVNHRANLSTWVDFPAETYKGVTYQMQSTDIVKDDDGGETAKHTGGLSLSENNDEGEGWSGMRDLDHKSENVRNCIKAYVDFLVNDLGYTGFRYDMTRGFWASRVAEYNASVGVQYSVGENWSSQNNITTWINQCRWNDAIQSASFDFPFRYTVRDVVRGYDDSKNAKTWKDLTFGGVASTSQYKRYAVTFVENHDTQYRDAANPLDPISKDTLAANAYLLTMPGTPCVFLPHWKDYKQDIKNMIDVRKAVGVTNMSSAQKANNSTSYALSGFRSSGTGGKYMGCIVGDAKRVATASVVNRITTTSLFTDLVEVTAGYGYRLYMSKNCETAWVDKASGKYTNAFDATLTAVTASTSAKLVYTLDGSNPTASSTQVASGSKVNISQPCTLKVGILDGSAVKGVVTRDYEFAGQGGSSKLITVYVNVDKVNWSPVRFYTWDQDNVQHNGNWPGEQITATKEVGGKTWYYKQYELENDECYMNFVFNTGASGSPQTVDVLYASTDKYYEVSTEMDGTKYKVNDVTDQYSSAITAVDADASPAPVNVYTIDGRLLRSQVSPQGATAGLPQGIYVVGKRKVVVR